MKVLVVGSGAREHALAARLAQSPQVESVICAPGNGGTAGLAENVAIDPEDGEAVVALARERGIDFAVVGPEAPLVAGVADALREAGIDAFGPGREAARAEGSKAHSKRFMQRHGIPTADATIFDDADAADAHVRSLGRPLVVKADGLAAGKGVIVTSTVEQTHDAIDRIMRKREFGEAGATAVLEERLVGQEVSYHVVSDGTRYVALAAAQDHKPLLDGDAGPNTGGMGAYSPPPVVTAEVERRILERVAEPTLDGFRADGVDFRGALFIGLMIVDGDPYVIEYNVRFGDPETQVLMSRFKGDVLPLLLGSARGDLSGVEVAWEAPASMCVVLASGGYPGSYAKGLPIDGVAAAEDLDGVEVFHAGTRREGGQLVTSGGRVLGVTAIGADIDTAAERAYAGVERVAFEGKQYRKDIGWRARTGWS
ncbi:MAG: phosphoribosylamine--glycine ligase [Myxococcales bacterium]|nr:phosphoribosylamine--glycine ligase [Myxococcales bacterium]